MWKMRLKSVDYFTVGTVRHDIFVYSNMTKREHVTFKIPSEEEIFHSDVGQSTF